MSSAKPIIRPRGTGERRWFLGGGAHTWKAAAAETDGAFFVFEDALTQGKMTPLHAHAAADEALYVLEGEILVRIGEREERVEAGGFTFSPRGVAHAFVVLSPAAKVLTFQTPGAGDAFYRGASEPAGESDVHAPVDFERVRQVAELTHAVDLLGPPPFEPAVSA